jgi:hypothetical protein
MSVPRAASLALAAMAMLGPLAMASPSARPGPEPLATPAERRSPPGRRLAQPLPLPPPPAPPLPSRSRGELAPMPNRDIEAPPDRHSRPLDVVVEPTIIEPTVRRRGFTFGREHAPDQEDRLFQELAPGARLRIPFE